jgi:hypothetical protein
MSTIPTGTPAKKGQLADTGQPLTAPTTANVQATSSLGQAAPAIPSHAHVQTVTPLEGGEPVLMTLQEIGDHVPPKPEKAVERTASEKQAIVANRPKQKRLKRTDPSTFGVRLSARQEKREKVDPPTARQIGAGDERLDPVLALPQPPGCGDMATPEQSLTITPLDNGVIVVPMTQQQIKLHSRLLTPSEVSALAPPRPKRPESLEFGPMTTHHSGDNLLYSFRLRGVPVNSPLTTTILQILDQQLKPKLIDYSRSDPKLMEDGDLEISLTAKNFYGTTTIAENVYTGARYLFSKFRDLEVSERDCTILGRCEHIFRNLSREDWDRTRQGIVDRALFIRGLLIIGEFHLAFPLLRDLADVCHQTKFRYLLEGEFGAEWAAIGLSLIRDKYPITSRELTELAFERLKEYPLMRDRRLAQAGWMLLPSILDPDFQTDFHNAIREELFTAIRDLRKECGTEEADALLQDLLDLPNDVRGELLLDPRARRLLLMAGLRRSLLEEIEGNAYEVFVDRREALEIEGIVFSGNALADEPVQISGAHIEWVVSGLFDLAEAAVMCAGQINWATGVLQFLSDQKLDDHEVERAKDLRDRIQIAVEFDPDTQVAAKFDTIKRLTDEAIAKLQRLNS